MKRIISILIIVIVPIIMFSQESDTTNNSDTLKYWKKGGEGSLNFSQVYLENWSAGGEKSVSGNAIFGLFANYKKDNIVWNNSLLVAYGLTQQGVSDIIKNDDRLELVSSFGKQAKNKWYYSALLNAKTQIDEGYNYPNDSIEISNFLSPLYTVVAIGMDYKPSDNFNVMLSVLSGKITYVNDQRLADLGEYGVEPAELDNNGDVLAKSNKIRSEFGAYIDVIYKTELMKNVGLKTKLNLFSNYLESPENIDINWEVYINMKVNKYISANINTHLIYDHDVLKRTQFKEVFGLGISYKF